MRNPQCANFNRVNRPRFFFSFLFIFTERTTISEETNEWFILGRYQRQRKSDLSPIKWTSLVIPGRFTNDVRIACTFQNYRETHGRLGFFHDTVIRIQPTFNYRVNINISHAVLTFNCINDSLTTHAILPPLFFFNWRSWNLCLLVRTRFHFVMSVFQTRQRNSVTDDRNERSADVWKIRSDRQRATWLLSIARQNLRCITRNRTYAIVIRTRSIVQMRRRWPIFRNEISPLSRRVTQTTTACQKNSFRLIVTAMHRRARSRKIIRLLRQEKLELRGFFFLFLFTFLFAYAQTRG